jgi:hypothetical protein
LYPNDLPALAEASHSLFVPQTAMSSRKVEELRPRETEASSTAVEYPRPSDRPSNVVMEEPQLLDDEGN